MVQQPAVSCVSVPERQQRSGTFRRSEFRWAPSAQMEWWIMVNHCANPKCAKPLHYLREGRIFVFDVPSTNDGTGKRTRRMEHYWLCGACSQTLVMQQSAEGVRVVARRRAEVQAFPVAPQGVAS